ncbi:MAG: hypothetical protein HQ486_08515 [Acidimicrobiaceae bacterium]|nr:hypothetical protein [Acidimicrobiaceae bacterium]
MDPAHVDRRRGLLVGISESSLTVRNMVLPGITGKLEQKILSTTMQGASTRLVKSRDTYASEHVGHFSSSFDLVVLSGAVRINGRIIKPISFVQVKANSLISEFSVEANTTAIMCNESPLKFESDQPVKSEDVIFGEHYLESRSNEVETQFCFRLTPLSLLRQCWVQIWGGEGSINHDLWQNRNSPEECFVLRGPIEVSTNISGDISKHVYESGGYFSFPLGIVNKFVDTSTKSCAMTIHFAANNSRLDTFTTLAVTYGKRVP